MSDRIITAREVATMLGVKQNTVYQWIVRKTIPFKYYRYDSGMIRFNENDILEYLKRVQNNGTEENNAK